MRFMASEARGAKPQTNRQVGAPHLSHPLRMLSTERPNQMWAVDLTLHPDVLRNAPGTSIFLKV